MIKPDGFNCMVTMQSWMFLSSFEKMRKKILSTRTIVNLMHMENMVMGIAFGTAVTNLYGKHIDGYKGFYNHVKMSDIVENAPVVFPPDSKRNTYASADNFAKIPGSPVAYWVSEKMLRAFEVGKLLSVVAEPKQGLKTGDNDTFLRFWYEISFTKSTIRNGDKWFPCNKGGEYRRWYGNNDYFIDWENDGYKLKNFRHKDGRQKSRPQNLSYMGKEGLTYTNISSSNFGIRYSPKGTLFDAAGSMIFTKPDELHYMLGLLSSRVVAYMVKFLSATMSFEVGQLGNLTILYSNKDKKKVDELVHQNITLSRADWDSFETSWDFKKHPLINGETSLKSAFAKWERETAERFATLKSNEEELNRIFIDIYGLQDELTPEVEDKDVTVRRADFGRDVKSFVSYAVGGMFGRYSLDEDGLIYAGGQWDAARYKAYLPEDDNILPITDADYFNDDIVVRFVDFVKTVYGEGTLSENLDFIADALYPNANGTAREKIRRYFMNDFYKDHVKTYQKKPIYWQFDSGKQGGFKALVYLHRYDQHTVGRVRTEYLHPLQRKYEAEIERLNALSALDSTTAKEKADNAKRDEVLRKKITECREYDHIIAHIAVQNIELDLDDGVTVNYVKFQGVEIAQGDGRQPVKMDLLTKI